MKSVQLTMSTIGDISAIQNKNMKEEFNEQIQTIAANSNYRSDYFTSERYNQIINEIKEAKSLKADKLPLSSKQYRRLKRFNIITVGGNEKLIENVENETDNFRYYCKTDDMFDIIETAHLATGHKKTRVMETEINKNYCNVTRTAINIYLLLCEQCQGKKKIKKKGLVVARILSNPVNSRCQVELIDMQTEPDEYFRFIFKYQGAGCKTKWNIRNNSMNPLKNNATKTGQIAKKIKMKCSFEEMESISNINIVGCLPHPTLDQCEKRPKWGPPKSNLRRMVTKTENQPTVASKLMYNDTISKNEKEGPQHPVDTFLASIAVTLKTYSPYHLHLAKAEIFNTVQKYELETIMGDQRIRTTPNSPFAFASSSMSTQHSPTKVSEHSAFKHYTINSNHSNNTSDIVKL